jgi:hypothetical protein
MHSAGMAENTWPHCVAFLQNLSLGLIKVGTSDKTRPKTVLGQPTSIL